MRRFWLAGALLGAGCFDADSAGVIRPDATTGDLGADVARADDSRSADAAVGAMDSTTVRTDATAGDSGLQGYPDGSVLLADGGVRLPDGAVVAPPSTGCVPMELCNNGLDDNCDGTVDEQCPCLPGMMQRCYPGHPTEAGRGVCRFGTQRCEGVGEFGLWGACAGAGHPMDVQCGGGMDWRCDGVVDEGCDCTPGMTRSCYDGPADTLGLGACHAGTSRCIGGGGSVWGPCVGEVTPAIGQCDGNDRACTGLPMEGCACLLGQTRPCYGGAAGTDGVGACHAGTQTCARDADGVVGWGSCAGEVDPTDDLCDGIDRSCTGSASRCACVAGATLHCYDGAPGTEGVGPCVGGTQRCIFTGGGSVWGACEGQVTPQADRCDGVDRACVGGSPACTCIAGQTRSCYTGPAGTRDVGLCHGGTQSCVVTGSSSTWSDCAGQVTPATDTCDGVDRSCSGASTRCACVAGTTRHCYDGAAGTEGVGNCHGGTQTCMAASGASGWGACVGEVTTACVPCITASGTPWQMHRASGPVCFGRTFSVHGDPGEYALASIPAETDAAWTAVGSSNIAFYASSSLCGTACTCSNGGEFTFFQTFFTVPAGYAVSNFFVRIGSVDDGVRITVFNSRFPGGVVDPGSYVLLGGSGTTTDLAGYLATGRNRIVLTHIDDCCSARSIDGVSITVNGSSLGTCM